MRQTAATGVVITLLLGLSACGGGPDLGPPPPDAPPAKIDMSNKMDKMKDAMKQKSMP
jgi:hypothetical protein